MKKSTPHSASFMVPMLAAAMATLSCAGGESTGGGTGATTGGGTGGRVSGGGSGGSTFVGTGGSTFGGSGGRVGGGSGGSTFGGTGGSTFGGTGGSTFGGTGGSTGGGTGGATVGGTGGASTTGGLSVMGGFASNGTWTGYAYTATFPATGSVATVNPACPTPCYPTTNTRLCADGMVGAQPTTVGASGAILGWSINQAISTTAAGTPVMNRVPAGTGLMLTLSAPVTGGRVQLQDTNGNQWCYQVQPGGSTLPVTNMIPWASFNTRCYNLTDAAAAPYTLAPISAVQVIVPSAAAAVTFNFCINDARQY